MHLKLRGKLLERGKDANGRADDGPAYRPRDVADPLIRFVASDVLRPGLSD